METSRIINFTSIEDIEANIDNFKYIFLTHGVICLRGANLNEAGQEELTYMLGDHLNWFPNHSNKAPGTYKEDHGTLLKIDNNKLKTKDEILLHWHQEHVDRRRAIVSGVWNMHTFKCDSEVGNTLFVDMAKLYQSLDENEREFLKKSTISMSVFHSAESTSIETAQVKVVQKHWITDEDVIRIDYFTGSNLDLFEDRTPTKDELAKFKALADKIKNIIYNDLNVRIVHKWQEGDIIVVDLFKMQHAVMGGFDSKDRKFIGIFGAIYPWDQP